MVRLYGKWFGGWSGGLREMMVTGKHHRVRGGGCSGQDVFGERDGKADSFLKCVNQPLRST
jgi:hypothetical protein